MRCNATHENSQKLSDVGRPACVYRQGRLYLLSGPLCLVGAVGAHCLRSGSSEPVFNITINITMLRVPGRGKALLGGGGENRLRYNIRSPVRQVFARVVLLQDGRGS